MQKDRYVERNIDRKIDRYKDIQVEKYIGRKIDRYKD